MTSGRERNGWVNFQPNLQLALMILSLPLQPQLRPQKCGSARCTAVVAMGNHQISRIAVRDHWIHWNHGEGWNSHLELASLEPRKLFDWHELDRQAWEWLSSDIVARICQASGIFDGEY